MKDSKDPGNSDKNEDDIKKDLEDQSLFQSPKEIFQVLFQSIEGISGGPDLEPAEARKPDSPKNATPKKKQKRDSKQNEDSIQKESTQDSEEDEVSNFSERIKKVYNGSFLKSRKNFIIKAIATVIGVLFIVLGVIYGILGSPITVSSNVIFGERATFSAFLILIGFLVLASVFARKLLDKTFLKRIYSELEIAEGKTPKKEDDSPTEDHPTGKDKDTVKINNKKD